MTQHSTRAASTPPGNSPWGRLLKRPWPAQLVLVAALLLAVPFLFHAGATVHAADNEITGVTLTSPNPGELAICLGGPQPRPRRLPGDLEEVRRQVALLQERQHRPGGNAFPTGTSQPCPTWNRERDYSAKGESSLPSTGTATSRAAPGRRPWRSPWKQRPAENTEGDLLQEGRSTNPVAKPNGLSTSPSHDSVLLPGPTPPTYTVTGYQVLRGPDADNLAVLTETPATSNPSYSDSTGCRDDLRLRDQGHNADGLSPQSPADSTTTPAEEPAPAGQTDGTIDHPQPRQRPASCGPRPGDDSITGYQVLRGPRRRQPGRAERGHRRRQRQLHRRHR